MEQKHVTCWFEYQKSNQECYQSQESLHLLFLTEDHVNNKGNEQADSVVPGKGASLSEEAW